MRPNALLRSACGLVLAAYPATWRARYGAEVEEVLDQHRVSVSTVVDLAFGAFDAHRHPELGAEQLVSSSSRRRSGFVSMLIASAVFALAWAMVLSVRLRAQIDRTAEFQMTGVVGRAISLVQIAGALSLLAILAGIVLVACGTRQRGQLRSRLTVPLGVGLATSAAFLSVARAAGAGMEDRPSGGLLLILAVLAWVIGTASLVRMIRQEASDATLVRRARMLGWIGVLAMAITLAGSVWLAVVVSLRAPEMGAEILPTTVMAVGVVWTAIALRRAGGVPRLLPG